MFDKHDVTTKKLDVIVEKVGKVDANYAAQIEGYCSLLGEYGKKFETVCAMLALDRIGVISVSVLMPLGRSTARTNAPFSC